MAGLNGNVLIGYAPWKNKCAFLADVANFFMSLISWEFDLKDLSQVYSQREGIYYTSTQLTRDVNK